MKVAQHHFVLGFIEDDMSRQLTAPAAKLSAHVIYFHRVPCGTDFLQPPTFAILIATSYVDAHGQPPDGVRSASCRFFAYQQNDLVRGKF